MSNDQLQLLEERKPPSGRRHLMLLSIGIAAGALLLWISLRGVDSEEFTKRIAAVNAWYFMPLAVTYALFIVLRSVRWRLLLSPVGTLQFRPVLSATIVGYAGNLLLPVSLGEILRMAALQRHSSLNPGALLSSVALERVLDIGVLLAMFVGYLFVLPGFAGGELRSVVAIAALLGALVVGAAVALGGTNPKVSSREEDSGLCHSLRYRLNGYLHAAAVQLRGAANPWLLARSIGLTVSMWASMSLSVCAAMQAIGLDGSMAAAGLTVVSIALAMILPSAPGYIGAVQFAFVIGARPFGFDASSAVAASVVFQVGGYAVVALLTSWALSDLRTVLRWVTSAW